MSYMEDLGWQAGLQGKPVEFGSSLSRSTWAEWRIGWERAAEWVARCAAWQASAERQKALSGLVTGAQIYDPGVYTPPGR